MAIIGKIKTLFEDEAHTEAIFPRTKTKDITNDNGENLDVLQKVMVMVEETILHGECLFRDSIYHGIIYRCYVWHLCNLLSAGR